MQPTEQALHFVKQLKEHNVRFVLAESCTAGLVAATLGAVPGISEWMCGSSVTYRDQTKIDWLSIPPQDIRQHTSVSEKVTLAMAVTVLERTPEATLSAAVTGHLGPDAPSELDGLIFVAIGIRMPDGAINLEKWSTRLKTQSRHERQDEATGHVIRHLIDVLENRVSKTR